MLLRVCVRRYLDISRTVLKLDILDSVTDLSLINTMVTKYRRFERRSWLGQTKRYFEDASFTELVDRSLFTTGVEKVSGSAVAKSEALITGESKVESKTKALSAFRVERNVILDVTMPAAEPFTQGRAVERLNVNSCLQQSSQVRTSRSRKILDYTWSMECCCPSSGKK